MNIKNYILIAVAAVIIAGQTYFLFDLYSKNKALEKSFKVMDKQLEAEKKSNYDLYNSLTKELEDQITYTGKLQQELTEIETRIDVINKKSTNEKNRVNSINDAAILTDFLTKRYNR